MRTILLQLSALTAVTALFAIGGQSMTEKGQLKTVDTVQGSNFLTIRAALEVLRYVASHVQRYRIAVVRDGESVVVLCARMDERQDVSAQVGAQQGANSELPPAQLHSYFSKIDQLKLLDRIYGKSYLAIQTAATVFQQRNPALDLVRYRITVARENDSAFVIFTDKDAKPGGRGAPGSLPGFEVELTAADLRVVRSQFIR